MSYDTTPSILILFMTVSHESPPSISGMSASKLLAVSIKFCLAIGSSLTKLCLGRTKCP